jgi:hypothetical protein
LCEQVSGLAAGQKKPILRVPVVKWFFYVRIILRALASHTGGMIPNFGYCGDNRKAGQFVPSSPERQA